MIGNRVDCVGGERVVVSGVGRCRGARYVIHVARIVNADIAALPHERSWDVIDVTSAGIAIHHCAHGEGVLDHGQIDHRIDAAAGISVAGIGISRVDVTLGDIEFRLVRNVSQHSGLGTGTEQRALRPFEHFDALQIRRIHIQIASRHLAGLLIQINCDVRETTGAPRALNVVWRARQAAHVDVSLTRPGSGRRHVR